MSIESMGIFKELTIGHLTLKNRICVPALVNFEWADESGQATDKHVEHYRSLAKGGAGLIVQEATCVSPEGVLANSELGLWDDSQMTGLKRIVDAVHDEGVSIFIQLHHAGLISSTKNHLAPSDYETTRKGKSMFPNQ